MVLDECLAYPATQRRGARHRWSAPCAGPARCRERLLQLRSESADRRHGHQSGPGAVRDRPGRGVPGPARRERGRDGRDRLRGLRHRRTQRRRADRRSCTTSSEHDRRAAAGPPAALSDGRRHAEDLVECVARGIDMFDCVHADAERAERPALHQRGRSTSRTRAMPRTIGPVDPAVRLLHLPAPFRAPICGICIWPAK